MPHAPATHLTITPKHVYINGEPVCVVTDTLELSAPTPVDIQTVTLTIIPTTVTILNEDNPDAINVTREAVTRSTRDEADNSKDREVYLLNCTREALDNWKRLEATHKAHTRTTLNTRTHNKHKCK